MELRTVLRRYWRPLLALLVIATAVVIVVATPLGKRLFAGQRALEGLADTAWAAPALVGLYIVSFGLGIPGSALFVAAGLVFPPLVAAALGALGGTLGSLVAHGIGRALGAEAGERWRAKRGFAVVAQSLDFTGILTLRFMPFFPHSLVNYGSGIMAAPVGPFAAATAIGLWTKAFVYGRLAYSARSATEALDFARVDVWGLLLGLALLSLLARFAVRRRAGDAAVAASVR